MTDIFDDSLQKLNHCFLSEGKGLCSLFDMFQATSCIRVPEHELTINKDNITFGPNQYTVQISQLEGSNMRIVYFCLLHYIFQSNPDDEGTKIYRNILLYIRDHDVSVATTTVNIPDQEVKNYYAKFLYSLFQAKSKRKVVSQELSTLPQMDFLLKNLIQHISGQNDLILEINADQIQKSIKKHLDFSFEFVTNELFIFQKEYIVEIRHFEQHCSFFVRHQKAELVNWLKSEVDLGSTAFFFHEINQELSGMNDSILQGGIKRKFKVTKKSTVKSIALESIGYEDDMIRDTKRSFGGLLDSEIIDPQNTKLMKKSAFKKEQQTQGFHNFSIEDYQKEINKKLTLHTETPEMIPQNDSEYRKDTEGSQMGTSSIKSIKSTSNVNKGLRECWWATEIQLKSNKLRKHKDSFDRSYKQFPSLFPSAHGLNICRSTKLIRSPEKDREKKVKAPSSRKRVPTFILERQKAKQLSLSASIIQGKEEEGHRWEY